jgi:RNA-directed DNA polymerase
VRRIASLSNLKIAWSKLNKRNKLSSGVDGISIEAFQNDADTHLRRIAREIASGTYKFRGSKGALIDKNDGSKRPLKIATVSDRVVAKSIALYLGPKLSKFDQPCSFAYRKKRSTKDAVDEIHRHATEGLRWVLEADIKKFFDKVDREILLKKLGSVVRSETRMAFIRRALTSELENKSQIDPDLLGLFPSATEGIPQGNTLSPLLANFYMYSFDKAMSKKGYGLVRYADDFVVMCKTEQEANAAFTFAQKFLKKTLKLDLHDLSSSGKTTIRRYADGFKFVGYFIRDGKKMVPKESKEKYKARIKEILSDKKDETLLRKIQRLNNAAKGWHEAFREAELENFPQEADDLLYLELSRFLKEKHVFRKGDILSWRQVRFLGVESLRDRIRKGAFGQNTSPTVRKGRGPRTRSAKPGAGAPGLASETWA